MNYRKIKNLTQINKWGFFIALIILNVIFIGQNNKELNIIKLKTKKYEKENYIAI